MQKITEKYWPLIPALLAYSYFANKFNFIQDDAYISYRYVANFLNGHGLVYNIGERIEGFTNFGWVVYMALCGKLGADFILVSRITGFLFGVGVIALSYLLAVAVFGRSKLPAVLVVLLVGLNMSLAYWSPAGLETAAFSFFALLSFYLFVRMNRWLVFAILMAVWIRPEGAVIAGIIIMTEAIMYRRLPKFSLSCVAVAFVLSLPFVVFKYLYYGSIFPNPFYAKTGIHMEQLANGLEYTWRFLSHYGFYGAGLLIPLLFYKRLSVVAKNVLWMSALYFAYVILIGGDVLKVHRFFLPLFGPMAVLIALSLWQLTNRLRRNTQSTLFAVVGLALLVLTVILPNDFVNLYNRREKMFTRKMLTKAEKMKAADKRNFSVALATIGIFGYELLGHKIIDMVGLTDSTIARHSEDPIPGMESTWKEARHNTRYLLSSAPDYIIFSTDMKPSAPAEKALLLFSQFLECYRSIGWFYQSNPGVSRGVLMISYKRVKEITGDIVPAYPVEWVENYKLGLDEYGSGNMAQAISYLEKALRLSPKPYYPYAIYQIAYCNMRLGNHDKAVKLNDIVLSMDSTIFESHKDLYIYARFNGDSARTVLHRQWLQKLVPWYWPRMQATVEQKIREWQQSQR